MKRITHNIKHEAFNPILFIMIAFFLFFVSCFMFNVSSTGAQVRLETGLPNIPSNQIPAGQELPSYINYLFIFGLGLITFFALGFMTIGGVMYILAAGNVAKVEDAKDMIKQALLGLGLMLVSYLLLRTINPDLVNLKNPSIELPQFKGNKGAPLKVKGGVQYRGDTPIDSNNKSPDKDYFNQPAPTNADLNKPAAK